MLVTATMRLRALLVPLALVSSACGGAPDADTTDESADELAAVAPSAEEQRACPDASLGKNGAGDSVVVCHQTFARAPFVHLPDDTTRGTKTTFYAGVTLPSTADGTFVLYTRDGKAWVPVDADHHAIPFGKTRALPRALHAPTNRVTFTLYQFTGVPGASTKSPYGEATTIRLTGARAVVSLDGCAFDSRLAGTWEGSASERLESPQGAGPFARAFDDTKRVPIHVTLDTLTKRPALADYAGGAALSDETTYALEGTIDNFDREVTADGKTYPSLTGLAKKNPFFGAKDGKVELYRLGNMHGQTNDGHWVLTYPQGSEALTLNGMSFTLTGQTAPAALLARGASAAPLDELEIKPHIPYTANGHTVVLRPAHVGAHAGHCPR